MTLFRKEVLQQQANRLEGKVSLAQPISIKLTVGLIISIAIAISIFISSAQYSRKATVKGYLTPDKGIIKALSNKAGTIERLLVKEGEKVKRGQPLVVITAHNQDSDGLDINKVLEAQLSSKLNLIEDEIAQLESIQEIESFNLRKQSLSLQGQLDASALQLSLADKKIRALASQFESYKKLKENGFLSELENDKLQINLLAAEQEKQQIVSLLLQLKNRIEQNYVQLENLPKQYALRISRLSREQNTIISQLSQAKTSRTFKVSATHTGTITTMHVVEGETLSTSDVNSKPLMHIIPENSELIAELLLPSRSAGFVKYGHLTRMRFDAFPYQRFGFLESRITQIDKALTSPEQVRLPIAIREPVFLLQAKLKTQSLISNGQSFELKNGMLLEADILLEKRTIWEWLLEPIYGLNKNLS